MKIPVGQHQGKSTQLITLKLPDYVKWMMDNNLSGPMAAVRPEVMRHIKLFDAKPFVARCHACRVRATRSSLYVGDSEPLWWCDTCDPYQLGANSGKLQIAKTYAQALWHVEFSCAGRRIDYRAVIKAFAQAKGAPARIGEVQAAAFFA